MTAGIRAEIRVEAAGSCPVAATAAETDSGTGPVSRSVDPTTGETMTEEFVLENGPEGTPAAGDLDDELRDVFAYGSRSVYRFTRSLGRECPCECIEAHDCPVIDVRATGDTLSLSFHAPDMETLQAAIGSLRERYPGLDVRRLLRSQGDNPDENLVFVDRSALTDRQLEVLETAHRMGYFEHPKRANAGEVADELEITTSTFTEHLGAAQSKLLGTILDG